MREAADEIIFSLREFFYARYGHTVDLRDIHLRLDNYGATISVDIRLGASSDPYGGIIDHDRLDHERQIMQAMALCNYHPKARPEPELTGFDKHKEIEKSMAARLELKRIARFTRLNNEAEAEKERLRQEAEEARKAAWEKMSSTEKRGHLLEFE